MREVQETCTCRHIPTFFCGEKKTVEARYGFLKVPIAARTPARDTLRVSGLIPITFGPNFVRLQ